MVQPESLLYLPEKDKLNPQKFRTPAVCRHKEQEILLQIDNFDVVFNNPEYFQVKINQEDFKSQGVEWPLKIKIFDADKVDKLGNFPLN